MLKRRESGAPAAAGIRLRLQGHGLIECDSSETADTIAHNALTGRLCQRTGKKGLVVPADKEKAFRSALNSIGYGMPLV